MSDHLTPSIDWLTTVVDHALPPVVHPDVARLAGAADGELRRLAGEGTEDNSSDDPARAAVAIVANGGEKYLDTIHTPGWLEEHHLTDEETWKYLCEMACR